MNGNTTTTATDGYLEVTYEGDSILITKWLEYHTLEGIWPILFYNWIKIRVPSARIRVLWQGFNIHYWILAKLLLWINDLQCFLNAKVENG